MAAKSKLVPAMGVDGVTGVAGVEGVEGVTGVPETLISTHQDFVPADPIPNGTPPAFLNFQKPRYEPAVAGAVRRMVISTVWPGATVLGMAAVSGPPIFSPESNMSW